MVANPRERSAPELRSASNNLGSGKLTAITTAKTHSS